MNVVRDRAPRLAQPFEVRFEAAGGRDHRPRLHPVPGTPMRHRRRDETPVLHLDIDHLGVVGDLDTEAGRGRVVGVDERLAAAEEERVGAREVQRAAERRLEAHAVALHPGKVVHGTADGHAREALVGDPAGDLDEVLPVLLFRIGVDEDFQRRVVHAAHVARVPAVAAAKRHRRHFEHQHREARAARRERGAQGGIPAAQHQQVEGTRKVH